MKLQISVDTEGCVVEAVNSIITGADGYIMATLSLFQAMEDGCMFIFDGANAVYVGDDRPPVDDLIERIQFFQRLAAQWHDGLEHISPGAVEEWATLVCGIYSGLTGKQVTGFTATPGGTDQDDRVQHWIIELEINRHAH